MVCMKLCNDYQALILHVHGVLVPYPRADSPVTRGIDMGEWFWPRRRAQSEPIAFRDGAKPPLLPIAHRGTGNRLRPRALATRGEMASDCRRSDRL